MRFALPVVAIAGPKIIQNGLQKMRMLPETGLKLTLT